MPDQPTVTARAQLDAIKAQLDAAGHLPVPEPGDDGTYDWADFEYFQQLVNDHIRRAMSVLGEWADKVDPQTAREQQ